MTEEDERPKVSKTEEKESFLKGLDLRIAEIKKQNEEFEALVERNEELAARSLLGGKSDSGPLVEKPKEESDKEYAYRILHGKVKPGEFQ